jgi:uncharacterized membrane protein
MNPQNSDRIVEAGRVFFGAGIVGLGVQHFVNRDFVPVILPSFPDAVPLHWVWTYAAGTFLIATGAAILFGQAPRASSVALGWALLAALVLRHVPVQLASAHGPIAVWNNPLKLLTLAGGAFATAATLPGGAGPARDRLYTAFGCFGIALTVGIFGAEHFIYAQFVAMLVPSWVPGHYFWAYFCGAALIAAGAGMMLRVVPRLAAGLLGAMILVWFLVLHIPRALAMPYDVIGNEWSSVFEALAFSGIAFILARTIPRGEPY